MKQLPRFEILGADPEKIARTPPLASALQSFETSLFLVGLRRYPAALTTCASAVESTIRAIRDYKPSTDNDGLASAMKFAFRHKPRIRIPHLDAFRTARNDFIHQGFSPGDDGKAVGLLLTVGYPFLNKCLWEFHKVSLRDTVVNDLWGQIDIARLAFAEMRKAVASPWDIVDGRPESAIGALSHAIAICLRNPANGKWTDVDTDLLDHEYNAMLKLTSKLKSAWNFHAHVDCPMPTCDSALGCLVGLDEHDTSRLTPINLYCFDCQLRLGTDAIVLIKHLVGASLNKIQAQVLREYGLV